jgi:hypothetical protein
VYEYLDSTNLRPERVFDWWDVGASIVGCAAALQIKKKIDGNINECPRQRELN